MMIRYLLPLTLSTLFVTTVAQGENLSQVYALALQNDLQLKVAKSTRDALLELKPQAQSRELPSINLSAGASRVRSDVNQSASGSSLNSFNSADVSLNLTQSLYRRENAIQLEQADSRIAQAEAEYAAQEQELILRMAQSYFQVLSAQDSLTFAQAENAAIARQLEQARQRFEVGLIAITAVHETQAAFDQSRADLILAENELENAWGALHEITLDPVRELAPVIRDLPLNLPQPADPGQWAESAQQQNLAVQAAQYAVDLARQNVALQDTGDDLTVDLVGSHRLSLSDSRTGSDSNTTTVGVSMNLPLYSGGAVSSRMRQASLDYQARQEGLDQQRRSVNRQVRDAYRGVVASISGVKALRASTVSARSALEATTAGFDVGTRTMVDVLNAQRDLFRARRNYAGVRYNYILSGLQLKQAAGTLSVADLQLVNNLLE